MSWTVTAGKSPVQNAGAVVTLTTFTNDATGKTLDNVEIRYDGTLGAWQSVCALTVLKADTQGKPIFVTPGTTFAIPDPSAPVVPPPPTQDEIDQASYAAGRQRVETIRALLADGRAEVTQGMLDTAIANWNALRFDPAWEGLGKVKG